MSELELKLRVPPAVLDSLRDALLARGAERVHLRAHYFDTAEGLLASRQIVLRLRLEGRRWVQTLKTAGDGVVHRLEHEVVVPGAPHGGMPQLDWQRHLGSEPGRVLGAVLSAVPGAALEERHATDVERLHCLVNDNGGTCVEAALDIGTATAAGRVAPIAELELEHKGGPVQGLFDLALALQSHGGLWLSTITKAERGERLRHRDAKPVPLKARPAQVDSATDGASLLRALLQSALQQVLVNASQVAEGVKPTETVHQLRIGLRRLRTVLRELAVLSPDIVPDWDAELAALFARLGQTRDQEAVAAAVRPMLEKAGAPLLRWHAPPAIDLAAAVRAPRLQASLIAILALAHAGEERFAALAPKAARKLVAARLDALHAHVTGDGARFDELSLAEQHRVRKRLKRLRYLAELTAPLWQRTALLAYVKRLAWAQDTLGRHNDIAVAASAFRDDTAIHPEAWFAVGFLQAQLPRTVRRARKALLRLAEADRCWT